MKTLKELRECTVEILMSTDRFNPNHELHELTHERLMLLEEIAAIAVKLLPPMVVAHPPLGVRKGDWCQTSLGAQFWPLDPRVEEVHLEDIAHALSNLCRFGGHCREFYSVAQHSVLAARCAPIGLQAQALLHDATEAYLVDVPRPIKRNLTGYAEIEEGLARIIGQRFGVELVDLRREVKEIDERMLFTEKRDLMKPAPAPWSIAQGVVSEPYEEQIVPWAPRDCKRLFLEAAHEYGLG